MSTAPIGEKLIEVGRREEEEGEFRKGIERIKDEEGRPGGGGTQRVDSCGVSRDEGTRGFEEERTLYAGQGESSTKEGSELRVDAVGEVEEESGKTPAEWTLAWKGAQRARGTHLFVTMSPLRRGEKVASRRGSGRHARRASRALWGSEDVSERTTGRTRGRTGGCR